jgi:hypothetical protein
MAREGPVIGKSRIGIITAIAALATLSYASGTARADEAREFWPELNAFVKLNPQARLHFVTAFARGKESFNRALDVAGYVDVSLKPPFRRSLRQEDWLRSKYLWARVGYVHVFKAEGGVVSPPEERAVASLYARAYPPAEIVFEGRARTDYRWIEGAYSERYRFRGEVNREFSVLEHAVTPYGNVEWFYDSRYDGWSRILYQAGTEITFGKPFRGEIYLARQQDELPRESVLGAFGVVAKFYF